MLNNIYLKLQIYLKNPSLVTYLEKFIYIS